MKLMLTVSHRALGFIYILWIILAWALVGFIWSSEYIVGLDPTVKIAAKEILRFFVFMGPILVFILQRFKQPWYRWLGLYGCKNGTLFKTIMVAVVYALLGALVNICYFHKTPHISSIPGDFWWTAFSLSIIMEEIAFRGFLFYLFNSWNRYTVVLVTSLAFATKHIPGWLLLSDVSVAGFAGDFTAVFLAGCVFGSLYLATHSIWATSLVHSINNLIAVLFSHF